VAPSRRRRGWSWHYALYAFVLILLWPSDAFAWGPATHIEYGLDVLKNAALLTPFVRRLLLDHQDDFLYGCCAADIVVGKNFAKYVYHCHNWQVGLRVLDAAHTPAQKALSYGFLTHLAADIVAHNFFVPYKTVESFRSLAAKHTYWELRFDRTALLRPHVSEALRRIGRQRTADHDAFLGENLASASQLFSFATSKQIFNSMMLLSRLKNWQDMIARVAERSALPLPADEAADYRRLVHNAVFAFLIDVEDSRTVKVDPTGARSLLVAKELRRELRERWKEEGVPDERWPAVAADLHRRFREGIYGKLDMPDTATLLRPT
jgi:zinc dependent phospholipase C